MNVETPPPGDRGGAPRPPDLPRTPAEETRIAGTAGAPLRSTGGPRSDRLLTRTWILVASVAFVAALALGREVLVPLALASVFSFLLAPVATRLERLHLGRGLSAVVSVLSLVGVLLAVGWVVASQTADLAQRVPEYERNIEAKLGGVQGSSFAAPFARAWDGLKRLERRLSRDEPRSPAAAPPVAPPIAVRVVEPRTTLVEAVTSLLKPLLGPLGSAAMVVLLAIFLLAYRGDLRNRLIRLVSRGHIGLTAQALDDASRRLSRYVGSLCLVNAGFAFLVGLGLWIVGVPNAPLWGLLSGLLRFIPYVGVWIGALPPLALSFAAFDGWGRSVAVFLVVLGADVVVGNVVEPLVYGKRTGLSPLAVVVATLFWTALWGLPGLLLALPMTLCLAVVGRHVPGLEFLDVVLGDAQPLAPAERVYERLAALDPDAARQVAEEDLPAAGLERTYDEVMLGALRLASVGRRLGVLEDARFRDLCVGLLEATDALEKKAPASAAPAFAGRVLCLPAGDDADRVACDLLGRLLTARGVEVEVGNPTAMSGEAAERVEGEQDRVVCVASIPPLAAPRVRYLLKRVRGRAPRAKILAAVWEPSGAREVTVDDLTRAGADRVAFTLPSAVEGIRRLLAEIVPPPREDSAGPAGAASA